MKEQDREFNADIKRINEEYKKKQDEFAKESDESQKQIVSLKGEVNETKIDSELKRQYTKREIEGRIQCIKR